ncbi:hypothetical protein [Gimesia sp.]|uniref:hypothetical protein n=1 Tax=Gimesia sp. TaxID=2024833 RepID=UPI000C38DE21|nr:hypothetical protein [Gimesia sp.]MAX39384.1 hypothetical protein [Gimesia sp.]HAH45790.1 hypothetical protein [Planctomycetaceae bacterium]HBL46874.1 hypothetical protein [Planctomycetaceae bacterium]|tara:strand:+ start:6910 stop:7287 length:378 start_codon:yes stop_codon:yes gene_type:complete
MKHIILVAIVATIWGTSLQADEIRTWEGKWNNRKYNTTGPLKCIATSDESGKWKATFTGLFKGDPFKYEATFQSKPDGKQLKLSGDAVIRGHQYQWTGSMTGNTLSGKYKSNIGYYGEFILKEKK